MCARCEKMKIRNVKGKENNNQEPKRRALNATGNEKKKKC